MINLAKLGTTLIVLFMGQWAAAQQMDPKKMADNQTQMMTEALILSEEQEEQVAELNLKYSERQAILLNQKGSMFSKMGDMKKIAKEKNAELELVLTAEQMKKYKEEVQPKMRNQMRKRM
ncbi:hypothetical protein [Flagellimonas allohymeniacidonis]|uniref:DUF4890 domain-containing protein n=1 Tax=Flagellimonas allohymeniacidonis TaxID=2517819 RepID=A0A4Q8QCM8_9FLAO|nr:hypothetical protein [Allomuricauda hymeniacidonis]TAI47197.1 hypothetical protein EW142_10955 [Allomuricauda hymeniacidonis]